MRSERILAAAIKLDITGLVVALPQPARHHHLYRTLDFTDGKHWFDGEQGFVTETNRFVDREEGLAIAQAAGQIVEKHGNETILFSEDMW